MRVKLKRAHWEKLTWLGLAVFLFAVICKVHGLVLGSWVLCAIAIAIWAIAAYLELRHGRRRHQNLMLKINREILEDLYWRSGKR